MPVAPRQWASRPDEHPGSSPANAENGIVRKLSQETLAILGVGVALAALILNGVGGLRDDMRAMESRLAAVEQRQARTEGLLEGLRDAIAGRTSPGSNQPLK